MSDKTDVALKLFEAFLEQRVQTWMKRLEEFAKPIGITLDEAKQLLKPVIQKMLDKHFAV